MTQRGNHDIASWIFKWGFSQPICNHEVQISQKCEKLTLSFLHDHDGASSLSKLYNLLNPTFIYWSVPCILGGCQSSKHEKASDYAFIDYLAKKQAQELIGNNVKFLKEAINI